MLLEAYESKVEAIYKAHYLDTFTMYELIGNLTTYEFQKKQKHEATENRKEKNLILKATYKSGLEGNNIILMTRRFQ